MWWEAILIAVIPSVVTMIVTNWINKKKYKTEVASLESQNMNLILSTYKTTLDQYKVEIDDVSKRFTDYIEEANKRSSANHKKIVELNKKIEEKDTKIMELEKKVDIMIKDVCLQKGCSMRVYLKELNGRSNE